MVRFDQPSNFLYTAFSRKVVGKSARDNPERYCGWVFIHCFSKKFERMTREAMDVCWRVLKESYKSRFNSYFVRNSVLIISHITFRDCRVHIFPTTSPEIAGYKGSLALWSHLIRISSYVLVYYSRQKYIQYIDYECSLFCERWMVREPVRSP